MESLLSTTFTLLSNIFHIRGNTEKKKKKKLLGNVCVVIGVTQTKCQSYRMTRHLFVCRLSPGVQFVDKKYWQDLEHTLGDSTLGLFYHGNSSRDKLNLN